MKSAQNTNWNSKVGEQIDAANTNRNSCINHKLHWVPTKL